MSQMNPYMTNPNAELYAMLGQRAANLQQQGGSYVGAGSSNDIEIMNQRDALDAMSDVRDEGRMRRMMALQSIAGRRQARDEAELNRQIMEDVARQKMDLLMQEQELNMKLAAADDPSDEALNLKLRQIQDRMADINRRETAANAALASRNQEFGKEFMARTGELKQMSTALDTWRQTIDQKANVAAAIDEFRSNPNKGGFAPISGLARVGRGLASTAEGIYEFFTGGDRFADAAIIDRDAFGGAFADERKRGMLAAALRMKDGSGGIMGALKGSTGGATELLQRAATPEFQKDADRFSSQLLSDVVSKGIANAGTDFDMNTGGQQIQKVLGELADVARSGNLKPDEVAGRIIPRLEEAARVIYGPAEGRNALPKLVEAMDVMLSKAASQANELIPMVFKEGGVVDVSSIQNAAMVNGLQQASRLRYALQAGTKGKVLTSEQLRTVLGETMAIKPDERGIYNPGALSLDPNTEMGALVRSALGGKTTAQVEALSQALTGQRSTLEELARERTSATSAGEAELQDLIMQERGARRGRLQNILAEARAKMPKPRRFR
jgi:hypothetical protein